MKMVIKSRKYKMEDDLTLLLNFLRETYFETKVLYNLFPTRFENDNDIYPEGIRIWELFYKEENSSEGKVIGFISPARKNIYHIQINPKFHDILPEMVDWIVQHVKKINETIKEFEEILIIVLEGHSDLEKVLSLSGFIKNSSDGFLMIKTISNYRNNNVLPVGFSIRSLKGKKDYPLYALAIRDTFGHGDWFNEEVVEKNTKKSYYKQELDLIIEAPNGDIASFCTFRIDPISKLTELEPMGTVPKYRKLGLGKILLEEGFKRLKKYNPSLLFIAGASDNPGANKLYDSTGFEIKGTYYVLENTI